MSADELRELAADIKQNGLRQPASVVDDENGKCVLIDGRNRLDALELLGDDERFHLDNFIVFEHFREIDEIDIEARVASLNLHRRHLTPEKKRERIAALLKAMPQKSNRQIAEMAKTHHHAVGSVRTEMEGRGKISHVEIRTDTKGRKQPAKRPTQAKLKTANQGVPEPRATPEKRTSGLPTGSPSAPKAEIGPDSAAENIRLRARIGELENVKHLLEQKVLALESALAERTAIVKFGEYFARHPKDIGQLARKLKAILHPDRVLHAEAKAQLDAAFKALVDVIDKPVKDAKREAQRREELSRRRQEVRERNSRKSKDAWARRKAAAAEAAPGAQSPPADLLDVSGAMTASAAETAPPATDDLTIPERLRRAPKAEATP